MLRLRWSPSSPFTRKVLVVAAEAGVLDRIELVATSVADLAPELLADNPLAQIPVLALEDGTSLFDSRVICEYLDALGRSAEGDRIQDSGARLFPADGPERWRALCQQATADGLLDAALLIRYELRREQSLRSPSWVASRMGKITRALGRMADEDFDGPPTIGLVSTAVALSYLDFRFPDVDWRSAHERLATWYDGSFSQRPSMMASVLREKGGKNENNENNEKSGEK